MLEQISIILNFIGNSFLHIWPYLLVTIPLAVAVKMSGAAKYINRIFQNRPVTSILLATLVGAFSPFCSCSVVPVITALLISGVPLAPVMAFWIASPSMDPEDFFLSVATIGWELAIWRMAATLILSLSAGFITHYVVKKGWLGEKLLRTQEAAAPRSMGALLGQGWQRLKAGILTFFPVAAANRVPALAAAGSMDLADDIQPVLMAEAATSGALTDEAGSCGDEAGSCSDEAGSCSEEAGSCSEEAVQPPSFWKRLGVETWDATLMVVKFMTLAFFLEALIHLYVPSEWIVGLLGKENPWAIVTAAFLGVPVYTSNLAALPMVSGLLAQGMNPAAGLAFLISGPTTTLPAMAAVWGIARRKVFFLYVSFSLVGAVVLGYAYSLVASLL